MILPTLQQFVRDGLQELIVHRSRSTIIIGTLAISIMVMTTANLLLDSTLGMMRYELAKPSARIVSIRPEVQRWLDGVAFPVARPAALDPSDLVSLSQALADTSVRLALVDSLAYTVTVDGRDRGLEVAAIMGDPLAAGYDGDVPDAFAQLARPHADSVSTAVGAGVIPVLVSTDLGRVLARAQRTATANDVRFELNDRMVRVAAVQAPAPKQPFGLRVWVPHGVFDDSSPSQSLRVAPSAHGGTESIARVTARIHEWVRARGARAPGALRVVSPGLDLESRANARATTLRLVFSGFALLCIVVSAAGVAAVQLAGLPSRTKEIGVRRAVGARGRDIAGEVLREAALIGVLGAVIGTVLGVLLAWGTTSAIATYTGQPLQLDAAPLSVGLPVLIGAVAVTFAALLPARRASQLDPVAALRYE